MEHTSYAGFWIRAAASLIDTILILALITGPLLWIYGSEYLTGDQFIHGFWDLLITYILPAVAAVWLWQKYLSTPGKMLLGLIIVDAQTGERPSLRQSIIRYLGYYVSLIPLMMGFFWVGWDRRKQGFHDKLAGTVVVHRHRIVGTIDSHSANADESKQENSIMRFVSYFLVFIAGAVTFVAVTAAFVFLPTESFEEFDDQEYVLEAAQSEMRRIVMELEQYRQIFGLYPDELDDTMSPYGSTYDMLSSHCGCGARYFYARSPDGLQYNLFSKGEDCELYTTDDVPPRLTLTEASQVGLTRTALLHSPVAPSPCTGDS